MSAACTNSTVHTEPVAATHRLAIPIDRPGTVNILAGDCPGEGEGQATLCLTCAFDAAQALRAGWRNAQKRRS